MKTKCRLLVLTGFMLILPGLISFGQVAINTNGDPPVSSAMLDVESANRGLLIPRIALTAANSASPITSPVAGLLIYNTASAGTSPDKVCPGLYIWSGNIWVRLDDGIDCGNGSPLPDNCNPVHMISDFDGNVYPTVIIGTQEWMARNLRVSHYRNGDAIPNVTTEADWNALSTGAFCWYNNNLVTYEPLYGKLYNWFAVNDDRKLCPSGWHVPSDAEWTTLTDFLGGLSVAGGKLKEKGTEHWFNITGATNETCFTGLGGGCRNYWGGGTGQFRDLKLLGWWWSADADPGIPANAYFRDASADNTTVYRNSVDKRQGNSVRCIKD